MSILPRLFGQILSVIFGIVHNFGLAIVIFAIITRVILLPLYIKQAKSSRAMAKIQPKMKEIQKKYAADKQTMQAKMMELYSEHNYNPFAGCLPSIVQLVLVIGMFRALRMPGEYVFTNPADLEAAASQAFLWIPNLNQPDLLSNVISTNILPFSNRLPGLMPIISAVLTYFSMKTMPGMASTNKYGGTSANVAQPADDNPMSNMNKMFKYMMPAMVLIWGVSFTGSLVVYWAIGNVFSLSQQIIVGKILDNAEEVN